MGLTARQEMSDLQHGRFVLQGKDMGDDALSVAVADSESRRAMDARLQEITTAESLDQQAFRLQALKESSAREAVVLSREKEIELPKPMAGKRAVTTTTPSSSSGPGSDGQQQQEQQQQEGSLGDTLERWLRNEVRFGPERPFKT